MALATKKITEGKTKAIARLLSLLCSDDFVGFTSRSDKTEGTEQIFIEK